MEAFLDFSSVPDKFLIHCYIDFTILARVVWKHLLSLFAPNFCILGRIWRNHLGLEGRRSLHGLRLLHLSLLLLCWRCLGHLLLLLLIGGGAVSLSTFGPGAARPRPWSTLRWLTLICFDEGFLSGLLWTLLLLRGAARRSPSWLLWLFCYHDLLSCGLARGCIHLLRIRSGIFIIFHSWLRCCLLMNLMLVLRCWIFLLQLV